MRVAIVGYGRFGPNHARVFNNHPEVDLVTVVDLDESRRYAAKQDSPSIDVAPELDAVIDAGNADAVVVATPASSHVELTRKALMAGCHVLCEKPLAFDWTAANQLVQLAQERDLYLKTGYVYLHHPVIQGMIDSAEDGLIGDIQTLHVERRNLGTFRSDCSVVEDLMVHDVAVACHLVGRVAPQGVRSAGSNVDDDHPVFDTMSSVLRFEERLGDVTAYLTASWLGPVKKHEYLIVGSRGALHWTAPDLFYTLHDSYANPEELLAGGERQVNARTYEPLYEQADSFLSSIGGGAVTDFFDPVVVDTCASIVDMAEALA